MDFAEIIGEASMTSETSEGYKSKTVADRLTFAMRGKNFYEWVDIIIEFIIRSGELLLLVAAFAYASKKANSPDLALVSKAIQFVTAFYVFQGIGRFLGRMTLVFRPPDHEGRNALLRPLIMAASGAISVFIVVRLGRAVQAAIDAIVASSA